MPPLNLREVNGLNGLFHEEGVVIRVVADGVGQITLSSLVVFNVFGCAETETLREVFRLDL